MSPPVVGIGASAGGLEAFKRLFSHLPADTGLAFVFVQHLDPKHPSNLSEILARLSAIPVCQAVDGMQIEPNHLYVIPPGMELEIADQALRTTPRGKSSAGQHKPIDLFLRSLAQQYGRRAIGVILSGAGKDGAIGLAAVKAAGGVTFAQDPTTAEFDSMPRTATESECADFVMSPEAIAAELVKLGRHSYLVEDEDTPWTNPAGEPKTDFGPIFKLLREATDIDFSLYRESMIRRRIVRRLTLSKFESLEKYREHLVQDPAELAALQRDLLIGVTRFFRDPETFEELKRLVFPRLLQDRAADDPVRVWVPGCATGEEVYSIAIALREYLDETNQACQARLFASDISSAAIEKARRGKYAETIAAEISPNRLERHFLKVDDGYQIGRALREMCVFSRHDLMQDPPLSKMDLISCRNVLIFFGRIRTNVTALLHYALKPGGFFVLGSSEAQPGHGFSVVEGARSIYRKNETMGKPYLRYPGAFGRGAVADVYKKVLREPASLLTNDIDLRKEAAHTLLSRYRGAGVVVDENLQVLEIVGQATPFLSFPPGKATLNLLSLIPETRLFLEVEKLVGQVRATSKTARKDRVPYESDAARGEINLEVLPLGGARPRGLLILFEPASGGTEVNRNRKVDRREPEMARLKQDLADARSRMLAIMDQLQLSQQEDQDTVQEAVSANEELQTLNEELETAKEEFQSTNEELASLNEELASKNSALVEARDFALLIVEAVAEPLVVLDMELRLRTANPAFYRMFRMSPGDVEGKFFYSVSDGCWNTQGVRDMLERIPSDQELVRHVEVQLDFPVIGKKLLVLRARRLEGLQQILIGIEDVTERQERADAALSESEERFKTMADTAPVMIWVSGADKACSFFNTAWIAFTGRTMEQELGHGWNEGVHPDDLDRCLTTYSSSFSARRAFQMEYRLRRADGEYRWIVDNGVPRFERGGLFVGYIGSCVDITDLKQRIEDGVAKQKLESVGTLASGIAHDFNNLLGGVLSQAELALAQHAGGSSPEEEINIIRALAIRGSEIVRQLMIYAGKENEVLELVDVSRVTGEMLELLKVSVSKRIVLETDLGKDLPAIRANAAQLRRVLMNLTTNASEAIGDRNGVIRVTTGRVLAGPDSALTGSEFLAEGEYVKLEVSDTGRGMSPETQARVFDPFFTTKSTGRGLGLAAVHGIVRGLGGTIHIVTAPGAGTTFRIVLPCARDNAKPALDVMVQAREDPPQSHAATILIVEDEELLRQATAKMIRKSGFSVIEASDGSAGLDAIRAHRHHIDVLLLDLTLPGTPSREVFEEASHVRPPMGVIVTSAYGQAVAVASLGRAPERFIRKPYRSDDLMALIRQVMASVVTA